VVMYYWYELSYEEICQALSLTSSAVKSRLHRARRSMSTQWLKDQPDQKNHVRLLNESPTV
jgi:RNA polymerase sigma-70 factor, ECF subfamily